MYLYHAHLDDADMLLARCSARTSLSLSLSLSLSHYCIFRGGVKNLGKPELVKVMQRRRADVDGKPGPIKGNRSTAAKSACEGELATQLARRTQIIEDVSQQCCLQPLSKQRCRESA